MHKHASKSPNAAKARPVSATTKKPIKPASSTPRQVKGARTAPASTGPTRSQKAQHKAVVAPKKATTHPPRQRVAPVKAKTAPPRKELSGPTGIPATLLAACVLEELSVAYSDVCNYAPEAALAREGSFWLALECIKDKHRRQAPHDARSTWVQAQAEAVLKKLVDPAYDRWPATIRGWWADEHRCKRTNQKIDAYIRVAVQGARQGRPLPFLREVQRARQFIEYVVGNDWTLDELLAHGRHGPGSSLDVGGNAVHYLGKSGSLSCTQFARGLASIALSYDKGMWEKLGFDPGYSYLESAREGMIRATDEAIGPFVVDHDKLLFVHKGIASMRSIGAQPTLNVLCQLSVDHYLKGRLKRFAGIDLSDQTRNKWLACEGSRDWQSADPWVTLDKSSASNLVTLNLVKLLFPGPICKVLSRLRVSRYIAPPEMGGGMHTYQMYAGMGNGTTFSVETLIFASFAYATSGLQHPSDVARTKAFSVYGDDVIVRRNQADAYIAFAEWCGLRMNHEKSFLKGPFRESCGGDYYAGINVRAAYLNSEFPIIDPLSVIGFHNTLVDHPEFRLSNATHRIRRLFKGHVNKILPTDPAGGLGFRPESPFGGYTILQRDGKPYVSSVWHRPLYYMYRVKPKKDLVGLVGPWLALSAVLGGGAVSVAQGNSGSNIVGLSFRKLFDSNIVPERDMTKRDLVRMLGNQLSRLGVWKQSTWFNESRGFVTGE